MATITNAAAAALDRDRIGFATKAATRDTRIDVVRAIALIMIFVNHVPGQIFEYATNKNFGFSDAAEAFVLVSGMSVALAYGRRFDSGQFADASTRLARRAFKLYWVHLLLTLATIVVFAVGAYGFERPTLLREINIGPLVDEPAYGFLSVLLLGHQLGYNNILPLYAAVLLVTPLFFWLEARSPLMLLLASGSVWLAAGLFRLAPPNMMDENIWFLNPMSWQFLFAIGIVGVMHARRGHSLPRNPLLVALAAGYALFACVWVILQMWRIDLSFGLPAVLTGFDKTFLSLPRLLHVLALAYLVVAFAPLSNLLRRPMDHPLAVMGRHALPIFGTGTVLSMIGQVLMKIYDDAPLLGPCFVLAGTLALFALAYYLEAEKLAARAASESRGLVPARNMANARGR